MTDKPSNNPFKKVRALKPDEQANPLLWWLAGGRGEPPTGDEILDHHDFRREKKAQGYHTIGLKDHKGGDIHFVYRGKTEEEKNKEKEKKKDKGKGKGKTQSVAGESSKSGASGKK